MRARRFFEVLPAILAWTTLVGMFIFSWLIPAWVSVFIILFDTYWLLKTIYMSFHLRATYAEMQRNLKTDWIEKLDEIGPRSVMVREAGPSMLPSSKDEDGKRGPSASAEGDRKNWKDIHHLVILPMYKEPYEVVRESFESLLAAHYPKDRFIIVLALEERGGSEALATGERIRREYGEKFFKFLLTIHPKNLAGEIPGKSSNQSWAALRAKGELIDQLHLDYRNVLVSVFDIDTQVFPEYFGRVTHAFLTVPDPFRAIYQPIPLFVNNIHEAPAPSRVSSFSASFWQMMQQARPERLTSFSSQTVPLPVVLDIGYWQKDIVSEDSRVFWQAFLRYHGDFRVEPLSYPISMDANVAPTFWGTVKNIYKQQRRWTWGVENVPYMLEGFRHDPLIPWRKKLYWRFNILESFHSLATNSLMIFALGWLPLLLGGQHFGQTMLSYNLPRITRWIIDVSLLGISGSIVMSLLIVPRKPGGLRIWEYFIYVIQWLLVPITLTVFGAVPALESQTRLALGGKYRLGFWVTPKGRKSVAGDIIEKPQFS